MSNLTERVAALGGMPTAIGNSIGQKFGGVVRCEECRVSWPVTGELAGRYTAKGWPRCCNGHSMLWWTQRQIDAGEMPA